ncbi:hypothetical protein B9T34_14240 [Acinetobacter sp. ANC 3813]|nr:hypothetical protein B9T34_14240 [Acinetobacter sp. ANC 3813]
MGNKLPILLLLLIAVIVFLGATFHAERKRARSEEIKRIIQDAEQSLDQSGLNTYKKRTV